MRPGAQVVEHAPLLQSVPGQTVPHAPQLLALWVRSTQAPPQAVSGAQASRQVPPEQVWPVAHWLLLQQPRQVCPPQQSWPAAHEVETQVPPVQTLVVQGPLTSQSALVQQALQAPPQSCGVVGAQVHVPPTQVDPGLHVTPHPPQLSGSSVTLVSQPGMAALQSAYPAAQTGAPPTQEACGPTATPQAPQLEGSVASVTHEPAAHSVCPAGQMLAQPALVHTCPAPHWVAHAPQLVGAEADDSHPGAAVQSRKPGAQVHSPAAHCWFAAQLRPQVPQLENEVASATSQPSEGSLLQSA